MLGYINIKNNKNKAWRYFKNYDLNAKLEKNFTAGITVKILCTYIHI